MIFLERIGPALRGLTRLLGLDERRCLRCGAAFAPSDDDGTVDGFLCASCLAALPPMRGPRCRRCAHPFPGAAPGAPALCGDCLRTPPPWRGMACYGRYEGALRDFLLDFKFHGRFVLADAAAPLLLDSLLCLPLPDAIVPMPLPLSRLRARGYNQVQELALALGRLLDLPVRPDLLLRPSCDAPQSRLHAKERRRNLHGSFIAPAHAGGLRLWLLDDIFTTGSTARAATQALLSAGAGRVDLVTLARTPLEPAARPDRKPALSLPPAATAGNAAPEKRPECAGNPD